MIIKAKGFLTLKKGLGNPSVFEFESDKLTLIDFLSTLYNVIDNEFRDVIFDSESNTISSNVRVLINGRHYTHLPEKLNTTLHDGDEVCLFPPLAGG